MNACCRTIKTPSTQKPWCLGVPFARNYSGWQPRRHQLWNHKGTETPRFLHSLCPCAFVVLHLFRSLWLPGRSYNSWCLCAFVVLHLFGSLWLPGRVVTIFRANSCNSWLKSNRSRGVFLTAIFFQTPLSPGEPHRAHFLGRQHRLPPYPGLHTGRRIGRPPLDESLTLREV